MTTGPLVRSHQELFPENLDSMTAMLDRRQSFMNRAKQAFSDDQLGDRIVHTGALQELFDLWTELDIRKLDLIHDWYKKWARHLSKDQKLAVIFFGTFSLETLNINIHSDSELKEKVYSLWLRHQQLFAVFSQEEVESFINRVMLMSEAPLVPDMLDSVDDVLLRQQAYRHYGKMYQVTDSDNEQLQSDSELYAEIIVANEKPIKISKRKARSEVLSNMLEDVVETFNLSRRFHRKVFGKENIRPDIKF